MQVLDKMYVLGKGKVNIGDDFRFTSGDSINPICRNIRGAIYTVTPLSRIEIGNRVGISSACLWAKERITIGNDVNIGGDCLIMDNDAHPHDYIQRRAAFALEVGREEYQKTILTAPIVIEDDVWIGAHTLTHPMLRRVENSYEEIRKSKENLEQILHKSISYFAYPYGRQSSVSHRIMKEAKQAGFYCAFGTIQAPLSDISRKSIFYLPRMVYKGGNIKNLYEYHFPLFNRLLLLIKHL